MYWMYLMVTCVYKICILQKKYNSILNFGPRERGISVSQIILFLKKYRSEFKGKQNKNLKFSETKN